MTNKTQSIYATEIEISPDKQPLIKNLNKFQKQINLQISQNIILKKHQLVKRTKQFLQDLDKIKLQAQKYRNKIYQQQKQFQENIQNHIKYDINKWKDYDLYFRNYFKELEHNLHFHKKQNESYKRQIKQKQKNLKLLLKSQINSMISVSKQCDNITNNLTTKQSTINFSYSKSVRNRVKTQSSLPSLKPSNKFQRFKTIQSQQDHQQILSNKQRRVYSYMQSIGTVKQKQKSIFPMLINMLKWYKQSQIDFQNDWFAKIILKPRHYNKLIQFLQKRSITRKVMRKK